MNPLHRLRRHPFAVEAFFRRSLVVTFAAPANVLTPLAGPGLELDTYDGWGFVAIAMVETEALRPKGFPAWLGRDFFLTGYRVFTRFARPRAQALRGLRILRSDTDRVSMVRLGNLFTHYGYRHAHVEIDDHRTDRFEIRIHTPASEADLHLVADLNRAASLPASSPFRSMKDARSFAGPLPYTFSYDEYSREMVVIKALRQAWDPRPVHVDVKQATYFERAPFASADLRLANAFYVEGVPYAWKAGTTVPLA